MKRSILFLSLFGLLGCRAPAECPLGVNDQGECILRGETEGPAPGGDCEAVAAWTQHCEIASLPGVGPADTCEASTAQFTDQSFETFLFCLTRTECDERVQQFQCSTVLAPRIELSTACDGVLDYLFTCGVPNLEQARAACAIAETALPTAAFASFASCVTDLDCIETLDDDALRECGEASLSLPDNPCGLLEESLQVCASGTGPASCADIGDRPGVEDYAACALVSFSCDDSAEVCLTLLSEG